MPETDLPTPVAVKLRRDNVINALPEDVRTTVAGLAAHLNISYVAAWRAFYRGAKPSPELVAALVREFPEKPIGDLFEVA